MVHAFLALAALFSWPLGVAIAAPDFPADSAPEITVTSGDEPEDMGLTDSARIELRNLLDHSTRMDRKPGITGPGTEEPTGENAQLYLLHEKGLDHAIRILPTTVSSAEEDRTPAETSSDIPEAAPSTTDKIR